ncbi:hypothetical protein SBDP1_110021 [Syntrophobacter sp. SbD1]|nr:hypothetical protein SBDP1_110021 [Syntrophobacter sp. SbD1]
MVPASWDLIVSASEIKAHYALSFADCFVVASALKHDASVVTGDPEFKNVEHLVTNTNLRSRAGGDKPHKRLNMKSDMHDFSYLKCFRICV